MIKIIMSKVLSLCFFMVLYSSLNGQSFKVPFTILEASDTLSVEEVISSDHLFKNADELEKSSPSSTYWIKLDFKEQNDRLQKMIFGFCVLEILISLHYIIKKRTE